MRHEGLHELGELDCPAHRGLVSGTSSFEKLIVNACKRGFLFQPSRYGGVLFAPTGRDTISALRESVIDSGAPSLTWIEPSEQKGARVNPAVGYRKGASLTAILSHRFDRSGQTGRKNFLFLSG